MPIRYIATMAYTKMKHIIEQTVASGLIYLNSHARDFQNPEMRPVSRSILARLQRIQGGGAREVDEAAVGQPSPPSSAVGTSSTKSTTEARPKRSDGTACSGRTASGNAEKFKGFAEQCMAEYDLNGWRVPDLADPGELSYHFTHHGK